MSDMEDYRQLMSDLVKKQMVMLGPNLVLSKARKVKGITVADDGTVQLLEGDYQLALRELVNAFMNLSGQIAQMTLNTLLLRYPNIKEPGKLEE